MPAGGGAAVGGRVGRAVPLAHVPAVVGAGLAVVDLLPRVLAHVVDEEAGAGGVRVEGEPERVAQPPGEGLLADRPRRAAAGRVAARAVPRPGTGCPAGCRRSCVMRSILPTSTLRSRDASLAARAAAVAGVVAAAVADADVEVAVLAEAEVAGVVVAARRGDAVDQHGLAVAGSIVLSSPSTNRDTRLTGAARGRSQRAGAELVERVVEVDELVGLEVGVDRHAEQAALALRADPAATGRAPASAAARRPGSPAAGPAST